jgi:3-oxoadipate enol-lactonase
MTLELDLAYETAGPEEGPTVVLLHSIGTDREVWRPVVPRLVDAGLRVVLVDLRGHGRSVATPGPYGLELLGTDVLAVLDTLGTARASVAGVSLGGMVAQWLGVHAPARVERLVLCCTAAHLGGPAMWGPRAADVRAHGTGVLADASIGRWLTPAFAAGHPDVVATLRAAIARTPAEGYAGCAAAIGAMDLRPVLDRIAAPTLVVAGAEDPATTLEDHLRPLADAIPDARLRVVQDASHLAPLERPDVVGAAIVAHLTDGQESR